MTLLNTVSNLGGTWPRYFVLLAVDYLTDAPCSAAHSTGALIKCSDDKGKDFCRLAGGTCAYISDGYYYVNTACFLFGIVSLVLYIHPMIRQLERLPEKSWHNATEDLSKVK